ncbi:MAG: DUF4870 domain-containing protein [Pirellulales bacterium]
MSEAFVQPPIVDAEEPNPDARTMGMLVHLLAVFTGFIGPLVIWLIKKDQYPFVDDQGKESLNFQITVVLSSLVAMALTLASCGFLFPLPIAVGIADIVFCILATVKANAGVWYRYPVCLRLIK